MNVALTTCIRYKKQDDDYKVCVSAVLQPDQKGLKKAAHAFRQRQKSICQIMLQVINLRPVNNKNYIQNICL